MELDPRRLSVLLAVHRHGGVVAAAEALRVSPSAVSQQMSRLEAESGVTVLDRRPKGAELTAQGRLLVNAAERIEVELSDARKAMAVLEGRVTGRVVIGGFATVMSGLLVPLVGDLTAEAPGVEVVLRNVEAEEANQQLRRGELDLLVTEAAGPLGHATPRGTRDVVILDEPWLVAMPAQHSTPATIDDLADATWLGVHHTSAQRKVIERLQALMPAPVRMAHQYADYSVGMAMVAAGLGVTILPALAAKGVPPEGLKLVAIPGLGTRQLLARHRTSGIEPRPEVVLVLDRIVSAAARL